MVKVVNFIEKWELYFKNDQFHSKNGQLLCKKGRFQIKNCQFH